MSDSAGTSATDWIYFYNEKGNDTAVYYAGQLHEAKKYEYDNKNRITKITGYNTEGESETTTYTYKPDGSFSTINIDKQFGLAYKETYDKTGKLLKMVIPDGSIHTYTYNSKGQLIKVHATPKNDGVKKTTIYTYNAKGQLAFEKTTGDYPADVKYIYDSKGLLVKSINIFSINGEKESITSLYTYEFR